MARLAALLLFLVVLTACGDFEQSATDQPATTRASTTTTVPGIGDPVRDGSFEFVVHYVGLPETPPDTREEPLGVWVLVEVSVANVKDDPQTFLADEQRLIVAGAEYESAYATNSPVSINPGLGTDSSMLFYVPLSVLDTTVAQVRLHDSFLSGGVTVTVTPDWRRLSPTTTTTTPKAAAPATTLTGVETFEALMSIHPVLSLYEPGWLVEVANAICYEFDIGAPWGILN